ATRAGSIAIGRHGQVQRIVWPMMIVVVSPSVEGLLGLVEMIEGAARQQLGVERTVEALVLAVVLRMERRAVPWRHAMLDQPYAQPGEPLLAAVAPRAAIVGQHDLGQAIA